jgi:hypothetical protein
MSRGLGREQRAILWAVARDPDKRWRRGEIQQTVWGKHPHHQHQGGTAPYGYRKRRWLKNVSWWRDGKDGKPLPNQESNFTRALRSLERRGLLERHQLPKCHPSWTLTDAGMSETRKFKVDDYGRLKATSCAGQPPRA